MRTKTSASSRGWWCEQWQRWDNQNQDQMMGKRTTTWPTRTMTKTTMSMSGSGSPTPTPTTASGLLVLWMMTTQELRWRCCWLSGEPLWWQWSCCMHRTTTRIWGCVGHGTEWWVVGDMMPFFSVFCISLSSPAHSQCDVWPHFF